ncbi:MAG: aspartate 1-decarboxylase [Thermoplasmatota archaeon]
MMRLMCWGKIHRAKVTGAVVDYIGSITIDEALLEAADILPYELVHVYDLTNGARLETYTVPAPRGSGTVEMNGAAARLVRRGHRVIVVNYVWMEEEQARRHKPRIVLVDERNRPTAARRGQAQRDRKGLL